MNTSITGSQLFSLIAAFLAVLVGLVAGFLGWVTPVDALAICTVGLSLVGIHVGGSANLGARA